MDGDPPSTVVATTGAVVVGIDDDVGPVGGFVATGGAGAVTVVVVRTGRPAPEPARVDGTAEPDVDGEAVGTGMVVVVDVVDVVDVVVVDVVVVDVVVVDVVVVDVVVVDVVVVDVVVVVGGALGSGAPTTRGSPMNSKCMASLIGKLPPHAKPFLRKTSTILGSIEPTVP